MMSLHHGGVSSFPDPKIPRRPSAGRVFSQPLRPILGGVPDAQNGHHPSVGNAVDQNIWPNRCQLTGAGLAAGTATTREDCETIAGKEQLPRNAGGRNRIVGRDIACDPGDIGKRACPPKNSQVSYQPE